MEGFTERHGFARGEPEIIVRHDAPDDLRGVIPVIATQCGYTPTTLRLVVCRALLKKPLLNKNWSDPNVLSEVNELLDGCEWVDVYEVIEEIYRDLGTQTMRVSAGIFGVDGPDQFTRQINRFFYREGIGWQLVDGRIEVRGSEAFESVVRTTGNELSSLRRTTVAFELHEAILDLSRRPSADTTGAIQHAMAALECLARDVGVSKDTLGALVQRNPDLFPKPLGSVVEQVWGWSSNHGRHLLQGKEPSFDEAELLVGLSGTLCRYLKHKLI